MGLYSISNGSSSALPIQQAIAAAYKTQFAVGNSTAAIPTIGAGSLVRSKIYDLLIGTVATPGDTTIENDIVRATLGSTPAGTTSISSLSSTFMLEPGQLGFVAYASLNSTAEVGIGALLGEPFYFPLNQRASYRWVCNPGSEIVIAAVSSGTGNNGVAMRSRSAAYTGTMGITGFVNEGS